MNKFGRVLFSMGLVGVLASGCGPEAEFGAVEPEGAMRSSAPVAEAAGAGACRASLQLLPDGVASASVGQSKGWLCSNFRLEMRGLPTGNVTEIQGALWPSDANGVGSGNLKLTIALADLQAWADWRNSVTTLGKCDDANEKVATLSLLGPDLQEELMVINFNHVGIISLEQDSLEVRADTHEANAAPQPTEQVKHFTVELYAEEMVIDSYAN